MREEKYREEPVGVFGTSSLVYLAIEPEFLAGKMKIFCDDITELLSGVLTEREVFHYASLIHLKFVHIHPFMDGNGRAARLLEKFFVSEKSGQKFWRIPSEQYYKEHQNEYYQTVNIGANFYELDYYKCSDFFSALTKLFEKIKH
ncbi:Fic family protein [bacterium]|nr:Fic family protein [bacterium]